MRQGKREDRSCPPRLEELKKEAQGIMNPDIFDGARFEFNKTLTQKFQLNHNITLGSSQVPPRRPAALPPCHRAACRHAVSAAMPSAAMPSAALPPCRLTLTLTPQVPSAYEFGATFGDERVLLRG